MHHSGTESEYSGNRLIVRLKPEHRKNPDAAQEVLSWLPSNARYESDFDELGIAVIRLPEGVDPGAIARMIEQHEIVEYSEPEFLDSGTR